MAGCIENEFINVLLLGSSNIKISQFGKLFGAYLKYDTFKEVTFYEPDLKSEVQNVKETTSSIVTIGKHNFHFINTPGLRKSYTNFKEIYNVLSFFKAGCRLHAIILLIEPDKKGDENNFEQYKTHFFSGLKQFSKNIVYVVLYNDSCMYDQTYKKLREVMDIRINAIVAEKHNVFHLNQDTFYELSEGNWEESVNLCRDIFNYITGLKSHYVQCVTPSEESFSKLIYNLLVILVESYFWTEQNRLLKRAIYISNYLPNVTVCYGNNCCTWKTIADKGTKIKAPKICHDPCKCSQSNLDIGTCSLFQTPDKNCSVCNCDVTSHYRNIYDKKTFMNSLNLEHEKSIAISALAQLFLFVKTYKIISIDDFISMEFQSYDSFDDIMKNLRKDFEEELQINSKIPITREKFLMCIYKLYEIKDVAKIIPQIINENFPEGLRLVVIANSTPKDDKPKDELKRLKTEMQSVKMENQNMKREMCELKLQLDQIFNFTSTNNLSGGKQSFKLQNCDNFNIEEGDESASDGNSDDSESAVND